MRFLNLLILPALLFNHLLQAQTVHQFSLDQCIEYALKNNESIENARLENLKQKEFVGEVMSDGLPQVTASVELANNFKVPTTFIPAIFFDPNAAEDEFAPVNFQTQFNGMAVVSFSQLIFDGSYFVGLEAARTFTELSAKDHIKSKIDVVEAVSKAYYTVLVNKERLDLVRANFYRIDTLLSETRLLYENGFAEKIDLNRVKVQHNNLKAEKENAERLLILSYSLLKFQMAMPVEEDLILTDNISEITFDYDPDLEKNFEYADRVEYSKLTIQQELARLDAKNIKVQYIPKVDVFTNLGTSSGTSEFNELFNFDDSWFNFGVYGLRMSIPIFDGLRKSNQLQQRKIRIQQVNSQFQLMQRSIDVEIEETKIQLRNSVAKMEVQRENMELAREVYQVTREKYQQGVGSNLEVIEADTDYKQAQTNYYNALYDALITKVNYRKALGKLYTQN